MAKVSYTSLKLKTNNEVKTFKYNDIDIEVKQYLPLDDKLDLIMITLQKAEQDGIYNQLILNTMFELNLVYMYTNISFTDKQRENEYKLYDTLVSNHIVDSVIENMDENEYAFLLEMLEEQEKAILKYTNTAGAVIQKVINDLPKNAAIASEIVDNFNPENYKQVLQLADAVKGGKPIV